jgi:Raf kinase inhibitor-like YbhB/YbcL family protein
MSFNLTSTAFEDGQPIPLDHTGEGRDLSPPLKWTDPPGGTNSFALICEDPDAPRGTWTHWVIFNMPAPSRELSEGVPREEGLANGTRQGANDFGKVGYGGPKPPPGKAHRYEFKLFALSRPLDLPGRCSKQQLLSAMKGHILGEAKLTGLYARGMWHDLPEDPLAKKAAQDRASIYTAPLE